MIYTTAVDFPSHNYATPPRVVFVGQQRSDWATVSDLARYAFGEAWNGDLSLLVPARNEHDQGFQTLVSAQWGEQTQADGAYYTRTHPGSVLAMPTADCPVVVGWQPHTERLCLVHSGRPALTPSGCCQCQTVLSRTVNAFGYRTCQRVDDVLFAVTPCISAQYFRHNFDAASRALIDPFRNLHALCPEYQALSADGRDTLDLRAMIRLQLEQWYQVPPAHIRTDDTCTFTHPALSSRRGDDHSHNLTLVLF